jgi:hypothetical protein
MKTQLLQDFQESGSAPGAPKPTEPPPAEAPVPDGLRAPPPPRPRPAVWHGPGAQRGTAGAAVQRAEPGAMQRAPDTSARGLGVAIEAWAERAAQGRPAAPAVAPAATDEATLPGQHARQRPVPPAPVPPETPAPVPPETPARTSHVPPPRPPEPRPEPRPDPGTIPRPEQPEAEADWLAARMRAEASLRETPAWSSLWKRRLVTWSIAGGLLAGLAAGGVWLYDENRVDGALVVVANTSPASAAPPAAAGGAQAFAAGSPAAVPAVPVPSTPAADVATPVPPPAEPATADAPAPPVPPAETPTAATPPPAAASPDTVDVSPPRRESHRTASARRRAAARARHAQARDQVQDRAPATPSPRERREETLMQCRAHGYDERQCIQRACTMTRYGLACKG